MKDDININELNSNNPLKYAVLVEWLEKKIVSGEIAAGEKIHSENELSAMFSISRHTVRHAISILENKGILIRIRGKGTFSVKSLKNKTQKTHTIGVVITYLNDYIFPNIIKGIHDHLSQNGYSMHLAITNNKQETEAIAIKDMINRGVDGIIVEPAKSALPNVNLDLYKKIELNKTPCVMLNGYYPNLPFKKVVIDDEECARKAVKACVNNKHKMIAGFFKSDDIQGHMRYLGYVNGLKKYNIPSSAKNVYWFTTEDVMDNDNIFLPQNDKRILKVLKDCTAIICYNDQIAVNLIDVLRRNNIKLPQKLSIVSFDDSTLAIVTTPTLSSFDHPKEEMGKAAASLILDMVNNFDDTNIQDKIFKPKLIIRDSLC